MQPSLQRAKLQCASSPPPRFISRSVSRTRRYISIDIIQYDSTTVQSAVALFHLFGKRSTADIRPSPIHFTSNKRSSLSVQQMHPSCIATDDALPSVRSPTDRTSAPKAPPGPSPPVSASRPLRASSWASTFTSALGFSNIGHREGDKHKGVRAYGQPIRIGTQPKGRRAGASKASGCSDCAHPLSWTDCCLSIRFNNSIIVDYYCVQIVLHFCQGDLQYNSENVCMRGTRGWEYPKCAIDSAHVGTCSRGLLPSVYTFALSVCSFEITEHVQHRYSRVFRCHVLSSRTSLSLPVHATKFPRFNTYNSRGWSNTRGICHANKNVRLRSCLV